MIKPKGTKVYVKDGNVEKALRKLKKKVQRSNILQDVKERQNYVQPSQKRKAAKKQQSAVGQNTFVRKNYQ